MHLNGFPRPLDHEDVNNIHIRIDQATPLQAPQILYKLLAWMGL